MGKKYIHTLSHLKKEWDFQKNKLSIHDVTTGSKYKAWWKCQECEHEWQTKVNNRVKGTGCPSCNLGRRRNILALKKAPHLEDEFIPNMNDKSIYELTYGSAYKAWWRCQKCDHKWRVKVAQRVRGSGCPHCAGRLGIPILERCPELKKEWCFKKNKISIHDVTTGSAYKAWWKCQKCNHEWQALVSQRVRGSGCPHCVGRFEIPLLKKYPALEKEWDFQRNKVSIHDVTTGSQYKAWWKCLKCGHEWKGQVQSRVKGTGCPHCAGIFKIPLLEKCPELEHEWDFRKNKISIKNVTTGSAKNTWWICQKCSHKWQARVISRVRGTGCPHCTGLFKIPLLEKCPELKKEWNFRKNEISIKDVTSGSRDKVWWKCQKCSHEWTACIHERARGSSCPHCAGIFKIPLLEKCPELEHEWDFRKNKISIKNVTSGSGKKVWWVCQKCSHKWQAIIFNRVRGTGCSICNKSKLKGTLALEIAPHLENEFLSHKNDKSIYELTSGSNYKAWWTCQKCEHEWRAKVSSRTKGSGCPYCAGKFELPLLKRCPELEKEWDFQKNKLSIHDVTTGSGYKAWWRCQKCQHDWQARVTSRVKGNKCPHCAGRFEIPLLEKYPELEQEWDFQKNKVSIHDVTTGSVYKVWWKCLECNHQWQAITRSRVKGMGCPHCAGRFEIPFLEKCPELEKEWDFQKNELSIHDITTGSGYKAWWKCQKCEHEWQARVQTRVRGSGCPHCAGRKA